MAKFFRLSVYTIYSLLCFAVAAYAFYFLFKSVSPNDAIAIKFAHAGLEIPAHFFGAGLSLLLVPFQLSKKLRSYSRRTHKTIGYLYFIAVLFGGISGFIMSFNATGGYVAEWGFRMMAIFWLIATVKAVIYAMQGNIQLHKRWIYRSIALTSAAITFRIYLGVGLGVLELPFLTVYLPISWLCWVLNLVACEIIIYKTQIPIQKN
ncbi:MAG: DUF2306 domain-containing protein [Proteobacteria bacterium]|nr:DUF2306 domain-containing protein [Pseudomonadota bacterium]